MADTTREAPRASRPHLARPPALVRRRPIPALRRAVLPIVLGLAALGTALAPLTAAAQTPGLVVDVASGRVLFQERATDPWFPASITKLMTVYVALDRIRQGRATPNTLLTMSESAAAQPPSKLGLKPGMTMTLDNALKVIMVKSANDIAAMIGENLGGGSIEAFAGLMNEASRRIGMRDSRWVNANGLPDERQQTSARDMALLARALLTEFPEEQGLFSIGAVRLGAQVMRNHNGLLGRYPGADGMKTGFICAGGFNVVATATQNGRRLIAVVMGYPSARERDLRTADLLDQGFASSGFSWGAASLESLPPSGQISPQNMRPIVCGARRRQPEEDDEPAAVSAAAASNADNPIASLFSPAATATSASGAPILGSRRTLGPRVAFEPIPVWIGATPGEVADGALGGGRRARIAAARKVRTERVSAASAPGPAARALTAPGATPSIAAAPATVKAARRPASQAALRENLGTRPAAESKPKLGAIAGTAAVAGANPDAAERSGGAVKTKGRGAQAKAVQAKATAAKATAQDKPGPARAGGARTAQAKPAKPKAEPASE